MQIVDNRPKAREEFGTYNSERMKVFLGLVTLAVVVTAVWVVANRLSEESLAVLSGAVCGVAAAIPTSLIIVAVSRRGRDVREESVAASQTERNYPPVVIVTPQGTQQQPHTWNGLPPSLGAPSQREFTVVGGESTQSEEKSYGRYF